MIFVALNISHLKDRQKCQNQVAHPQKGWALYTHTTKYSITMSSDAPPKTTPSDNLDALFTLEEPHRPCSNVNVITQQDSRSGGNVTQPQLNFLWPPAQQAPNTFQTQHQHYYAEDWLNREFVSATRSMVFLLNNTKQKRCSPKSGLILLALFFHERQLTVLYRK